LPITYQASKFVSLEFSLASTEIKLTNYARNPAQNGKTNVDQEIGIASCLEEDSERREEDGEEIEADVGLERSSLAKCSNIDSRALPHWKV
jgi:hypothetical protein